MVQIHNNYFRCQTSTLMKLQQNYSTIKPGHGNLTTRLNN
jgi:hypothetical protein